MSNICNNSFYAYSNNRENIETILDFFCKTFYNFDCEDCDEFLNIEFDSKWTFPEEIMQELFESIPDKSDIYMRCLSVEYGCMYHALWYCDEDGWHET